MVVRRFRIADFRSADDLPVLSKPLRAARWQPTDGDDWDLWWSHRVPDAPLYARLEPGRWINHIPGIGALCRKDNLAAELDSALQRAAGRDGAPPDRWHPRTFVLPEERDELVRYANAHPEAMWIRKPRDGARGEGVALVVDVNDAARLGDTWLVQQYVATPHLIDGYKYTLRFYAAITSVVPLVVYVFDDGFTKFASRPYPSDPRNLSRFAHLTNPDVLSHDTEVPTSSRNLVRADYRARLHRDGHDPDRLLATIDRIIAATIAAARERLRAGVEAQTRYTAGCFELLGFDILVDADLKPWLLECNLAPSLDVEAAPSERAAREEAAVKGRLVADLAALIGLTGARPGHEHRRVGGFRRIFPAEDASQPWPMLTLPRPADLALGHGAAADAAPRLIPAPACESYDLGDSLVVHSSGDSQIQVLNSTAAHYWIGLQDGMTKEDLLTEVTNLTGAPPDQVAADFDSLCASWRESGLMIDAGQTTSSSERQPRVRLPCIEWNVGTTFALLDTAVAVRVPHWSALDMINAAIGSLETTVAEVHHHVDITVAGRLYAIRIDGDLAAPPIPLEQLAAQCRMHVLQLADRDPERPLTHGVALAVDGRAWVITGPQRLLAALLEGWLRHGGDVVADAVVSLLDGKVLPLHLGFERWAERSQYLTRDYGEYLGPALVNVTNHAICYAAVPAERRSMVPMPLAAVVQLSPTAELNREARVLVTTNPKESLLALLGSRPSGLGPISRAAAASLVRALETVAAWSAATNEDHVHELVAAIGNGEGGQQ